MAGFTLPTSALLSGTDDALLADGGVAASLTVAEAGAAAAGGSVNLTAASLFTVAAATAPAAGGTVALTAASKITVSVATAPADGGSVAFTSGATITIAAATASAAGGGVNLTAASALTIASATAPADGGAVSLTGADSPVQYARPIGTIDAGEWIAVGAATIHEAIDETTASDAEYAESPVSPSSPKDFSVDLGSLVDPDSSVGHVIRYRMGKDTPGGDELTITPSLYTDGGTTLVVAGPPQVVPDTFTTYEWTLLGAEADGISDYTDLQIIISVVAT